jgi:hypothetical protein
MKFTCYASSFADPADIRAFRKCKAKGKSDQQCFKVGDNGIGFWGDDVSEGTGPACALPPEIIDEHGLTHGYPVNVSRNGLTTTALLKDHMPHLRNLANAARIDLNPDACAELGLTPPVMAEVTYEI